ncbi:MAG: TauD/TfdA family dioxygenase [Gammaproteobacteria bacterium]|nr:MAG: TauD/TfdA family dioxygenase [Gammaproteobacteria bacterium]
MTESVEFQPLTGCIGARVDGIDLNNRLDDAGFAQIYQGLLRYKVLLFPEQDLDPAKHVALGRRFGELVAHPDYPTIEGHEEIMVIENGPERPPDNEYWHKDMTFRPDPPHCSLLHARVLPAHGGDTMFADMEAVYADLSPPLQRMLEELSVVHDQVAGFTPTLLANNEIERLEKIRAHPEEMRRSVHPAIGMHPVSGKKYLGIDDCFVTRFIELSASESEGLLRLLRDRLKQPRYQVRIAWQADDLVIWDNVSTLHYAVGDYSEYRCMQRVTVSRYHDA